MSPLLNALVRSAAAVQDTVAALPQAPFEGVDSVVVESPLPGGVATVVRWLLNTVPWWFQAAGAVLAGLGALVLLVLAWKRRVALRTWLATRGRPVRWALAGALFLFLVGAAGVGTASWDYMQHDNGFCTGCHVMNPSFQEFVAHEDKHDTLQCHDCHQQSIFASMRQLYLWVAERPTQIGEHSRLPNAVCERCHVTGEPEKWQHIASTAGHRVHLESDSTALADVLCVTCHATEVHRFVPVRATCGQAGCHEESQTEIRLGSMAGQTAVHCTTCHQFTADVPALATTDSARGTLVPGSQQCLSCHEMREVLADFDAASEPHGGTCGTCHYPHEQTEPGEAVKSCASAQCHADWRQIPFHVGPSHRGTGTQCLTCHVAHNSRVDASNCEGCHVSVRERRGIRPPVRFDTAAALRPPLARLPDREEETHRGKGDAPPARERSGGVILASWVLSSQARDSFPHARHRRLACLTCHTTEGGHGRLTFEPPRGCMICHHQPRQTSSCETCHQPEERPSERTRTLSIGVRNLPARARDVRFSHETHAERRCAECHATPVTMAVSGPAAQCRGCHEEHHTAARDCSACHRNADLRAAHRPEAAPAVPASRLETALGVHVTCAACHDGGTVSRLTPNRAFCATCHAGQRRDHYEPRECTVCHFMATPEAFRSRLQPASRP